MRTINAKGQVLIYFTLSFVLLGLFIGLAMDGGRAYFLKAQLAKKVDPAALAAASRMPTGGITAATSAACNAALMNGMNCADLVVTPATVTDPSGNAVDGVRVSASAVMPTTFMRLGNLIGCGAVCNAITVTASAVAAPGGNFDLTMPLDDTASMCDPRSSPCPGVAGTRLDGARKGAAALANAVLAGGSSIVAQLGMVPFRGCYNNTGANNCIDSGDFPGSGSIVPLTNDKNRIDSGIAALTGNGGSGTNVCEGLSMARVRLFESPGSVSNANASKFIILLTDADFHYTSLASFTSPRNCNPGGTPNNTDTQDRTLAVTTYNLATEIKTGANVGSSGQPSGKPVTIFVILYGPGAGASVTPYSSCTDLGIQPPHDPRYLKTLGQCIAGAGNLYLAPNPADVLTAFQAIISRLPVRLVS